MRWIHQLNHNGIIHITTYNHDSGMLRLALIKSKKGDRGFNSLVRIWDIKSQQRQTFITGSVDDHVRSYNARIGKVFEDYFEDPVTSIHLLKDSRTMTITSCEVEVVDLMRSLLAHPSPKRDFQVEAALFEEGWGWSELFKAIDGADDVFTLLIRGYEGHGPGHLEDGGDGEGTAAAVQQQETEPDSGSWLTGFEVCGTRMKPSTGQIKI
ncbi:hypothetical protein PPACK8108_LOCUS21009 [Phakopsora pachyrhizi]|uniref:Uncharacterized protein n=1 Tax=Phakopsora pachyrhizi TaxID=170000 RepID=A0AAV0BIK6_PHAPC|nr:hypothetical protein PPACK8108_LOCUS21009 [Phakopsora pachyrhizi]